MGHFCSLGLHVCIKDGEGDEGVARVPGSSQLPCRLWALADASQVGSRFAQAYDLRTFVDFLQCACGEIFASCFQVRQ